MNITEVIDKKSAKEFLELSVNLYKNDPNFISPLDKDIEAVFDPNLNNFHKHGIIKRWIATDDMGKPAGRIAAFINYQKNPMPPTIKSGFLFF